MKTFLAVTFLAGATLASAQNADHGKQVFEKLYCSACHGHEGQGGPGPRIGVKPAPLAGFIAYVHNPGGTMPAFSTKVVSDADLADVRAYLASRPAPPPAKDIALLNQ